MQTVLIYGPREYIKYTDMVSNGVGCWWDGVGKTEEERKVLKCIKESQLAGTYIRWNCRIENVIEGEIKLSKRGGSRKKVIDDIKDEDLYEGMKMGA